MNPLSQIVCSYFMHSIITVENMIKCHFECMPIILYFNRPLFTLLLLYAFTFPDSLHLQKAAVSGVDSLSGLS
jgi:hypothetical protein